MFTLVPELKVYQTSLITPNGSQVGVNGAVVAQTFVPAIVAQFPGVATAKLTALPQSSFVGMGLQAEVHVNVKSKVPVDVK